MEQDSDYSDVSDVDEEYKTSSKNKGGRGYRIRNALKVPRATTYTAQALYDQIHSSDINLEPEYQRAVVWPEAKQIGIIDSILRNFYIPPVIFCVNAYDDGTETKTCIDGKQRLTSIHRFMSGLIPHRDPFTNEKLWYKDVGATGKGPKRKILPEKYRRVFANKQIVCVEYQDITDSDEREIFQRVQLGMALTPAEKIQVTSSPRATFIRELQSTYLVERGGLVGEALNWDRSRGGDFRSLAQAVFSIEKYPNSSCTFPPLERWLAQPDAVIPDSFRDRVHQTFRVLLELVRDARLSKPLQNPPKVAPIEFIMIVVLVAINMQAMDLTELSRAIGQMRDDVRVHHVDIRMNDRVAKTMTEFVQGLERKPDTSLIDGRSRGDDSARDKPRKKRKREQSGGESEGKEAGEISETPTRLPSTSARSSTPYSSSSSIPLARTVSVGRAILTANETAVIAQRPVSSTAGSALRLPIPTITPTSTLTNTQPLLEEQHQQPLLNDVPGSPQQSEYPGHLNSLSQMYGLLKGLRANAPAANR